MKQFDTNPDRLRRQQAVLAHLNFYRGKLDGVWGPESINAKKAFETSGTFTGGIPNQGLPFNPNAQLPSILYRDPQTGLVCHPGLDEEKLTELMRSRGTMGDDKVKAEPVVSEKRQEPAPTPTQTEPTPEPKKDSQAPSQNDQQRQQSKKQRRQEQRNQQG